jgi:hypothetical protein
MSRKKKNLQIKVWAEIEVLDLDTDESTEGNRLPVCLGEFSTLKDAQAFLSSLETFYEGGTSMSDNKDRDTQVSEFQALGPGLEVEFPGWKVFTEQDDNGFWFSRIRLRNPDGRELYFHLHEEGYGKVRPLRVNVSGGFHGKWGEAMRLGMHIPPGDQFERCPKITLAWERVQGNPKVLANAIKSRLMPAFDKLAAYVQDRVKGDEDYKTNRDNRLIEVGKVLGVSPDLREKYENGVTREPSVYLDAAVFPGLTYSSDITARGEYVKIELEVNLDLAKRIAETIRQYRIEKKGGTK